MRTQFGKFQLVTHNESIIKTRKDTAYSILVAFPNDDFTLPGKPAPTKRNKYV